MSYLDDLLARVGETERRHDKERKTKTFYAVFRWREDGIYRIENAIGKLYRSEKIAQKQADKGYPDLVVRAVTVD